MKVTYKEILGAHQAVQALTQNEVVVVAPVAALRLARIMRILTQETQAFEAGRVSLVKQYTLEPDKQGNHVVLPEHMAKFNAGIAELFKQEIEIDIQLINLVDFGECQMPLTSLIGMEWLIKG